MLDQDTVKNLEDYAKKILEEKKLEYPDAEVEIVYIPTVLTKMDGKVAVISGNNMNLIK